MTLVAFSFVGSVLLAQSPTSEKSRAELIRDIQTPAFDRNGPLADEIVALGPKAVEVATQRHDLEVLTAGLLSPRDYVKRLCLNSLDSFTDDERKAAMRASLLSDAAWSVYPGSAAGTSRFAMCVLFAEKLKHFGIDIAPVDLDSTEARKAIVQRLLPAVEAPKSPTLQTIR